MIIPDKPNSHLRRDRLTVADEAKLTAKRGAR